MQPSNSAGHEDFSELESYGPAVKRLQQVIGHREPFLLFLSRKMASGARLSFAEKNRMLLMFKENDVSTAMEGLRYTSRVKASISKRNIGLYLSSRSWKAKSAGLTGNKTAVMDMHKERAERLFKQEDDRLNMLRLNRGISDEQDS